MKELRKRKHIRLKSYDYSQNGAYFVTVCVKDKHEILGEIVGSADLGAPQMKLSDYGCIVQKYILSIEPHYDDARIDKYVIMLNHIHMVIVVDQDSMINQSVGVSGPISGANGVPGSSRLHIGGHR